jgi:hypothetical protein
MKPPGVGLIIRTEAKGQGENELFEDFEALWDRWQTVVSEGEASIGSSLIYRDQDLLYRVIRDAYSHDVVDIICDSADGQRRAQEYLQGWAGKLTKVSHHQGEESLLISKGVDKEIEAALSDRVELPSGGHLNIQPTEALTVIDVNSGRFTSSRTQAETVRRTNVEAAQEIPRQLRLRNIGGMVIVDFIDMDSRKDQQQVLEVFQRVLEEDRAKPQVGQLSDLGLVELTRRRQGQSLRELFTVHCNTCSGLGVVPTLELGPADNRRVITFKSKDDEQVGRGRGSQRGGRTQAGRGSVLRAASATNGRVVPTVEEPAEPEFDESAYVPEEILEQMPDELLMDDPRAMGKPSTKRGAFLDTQDDDELEEAEGEEVPFSTQSFAPAAGIFEEGFVEDEESSSPMHEGLEESISAVEEVYQDMGNRSRVHEDDVEVVVITPQAATVEETPAPTLQEEVEEEADEQEDLVSFASTSPYETEIDPVTGIYRLKIKPAGQEHGGEHEHEHGHQSHEHAHHEHAHSHEHHTHADHVVAGEAVEEQPDAVAAEEFVQSEVNAEGHVVQGNLFSDSYQNQNTHGSDNNQTAEEESQTGTAAEHENGETLADELETRTAEWQDETQQAQSEEAEEHRSSYNQEEPSPPQPQETHNS